MKSDFDLKLISPVKPISSSSFIYVSIRTFTTNYYLNLAQNSLQMNIQVVKPYGYIAEENYNISLFLPTRLNRSSSALPKHRTAGT